MGKLSAKPMAPPGVIWMLPVCGSTAVRSAKMSTSSTRVIVVGVLQISPANGSKRLKTISDVNETVFSSVGLGWMASRPRALVTSIVSASTRRMVNFDGPRATFESILEPVAASCETEGREIE